MRFGVALGAAGWVGWGGHAAGCAWTWRARGLSDPLSQPQKEKGKGQRQSTNTQYQYKSNRRMYKEPLHTHHIAQSAVADN